MSTRDRVASLLGLGAELSAGGGFPSLGRRVLASPPGGVGRGGRSELNGDGTPLQLCLGSDARGVRPRWVGDPAWEVADPLARLRLSCAALREVFETAGATGLLPAAEAAVDILVSREPRRLLGVSRGFLWLAAGERGAAVYVDATPAGSDVWRKAEALAAAALPDPDEAAGALRALRADARLASLGVEGTSAADGRLKVYFRLAKPRPLAGLGPALLAGPPLLRFLAAVVGEAEMNLSGAVFGLGFALRSGALVDAKVDLCAHCLPREPRQWRDLLSNLARSHGVASLPGAAERALLEGRAEVAFVGLGLGADGRCRLNTYLKPGAGAPAAPAVSSSRGLRERRRRCVSALLDRQRADGAFSDFRLPVGAATEWTTAYAGLALAATREEKALGAAQRAARWLLHDRAYQAGWGYNDRTGPDADSTGFALRLLAAVGERAAVPDRAFLDSCWRTGEGLATYQGPGAWGRAHPCVTAAGFLAFDEARQRALRGELLARAAATRLTDGQWPSYWWRTHSYSTWHHVRLLEVLGEPVQVPEPAEPEVGATAFDLAWRLALATRASSRGVRGRLLEALLALQQEDGAFPGSLELRVTDPDCAQPWVEARGQLYADDGGVLATASVLGALDEVLRD